MHSLHRVLRQLQDARLHGAGVPAQGRRSSPSAASTTRASTSTTSVMPVLKKWRIFERDGLHRRGCAHARRPRASSSRNSRRRARSSRSPSSAASSGRQGGREEGRRRTSGRVISVLTRSRAPALRIGPIRAAEPRRAGADGRCDERRIPHAAAVNSSSARAGTVSGLYVCEMVTAARARRAPSGHHAHDDVRAGRVAPLAAALHRRPGHHLRRGENDRRRGVGRPHRHELRLPGAQGRPGAAAALRCRSSGGCSARSWPRRCARPRARTSR